MGFIRQFLRDYGYVHRSEMNMPRRRTRAYAAAAAGRLLGDWVASAASIDSDIRRSMVAVRSRARDLSQNNEYAKSYLRAVKKNVVGSDGFSLQVRAMGYSNGKAVPDKVANSILEDAFRRWSMKDTASVTGKLSFRKQQELVIETVARDGESFVRIVRGKKINSFGFSLQIIEPDWIDEKYSYLPTKGNIIVMGVELDAWRRPVAYHVSTRNEQMALYGGLMPSAGDRIRIPAEDMIHVFDPERADQTRGVSWMAPAMIPLHNLKGYMEAAVINARIGASKMGFFRDPEDAPGQGYTGDDVDSAGNAITTVEPGVFEDIGRKEFVGYTPQYPEAQFDPFTKSILRGISAGLGVSFSSISNDLTEVNFSSIRAGLLEERETWKSLQAWFVEMFLNRVYAEWLNMALLTQSVRLPAAKFDKFNAPKWTGRRWSWVKPLEEVKAAQAARASGFKSATQIISESGGDIEELYQELEDEKKLAEEHGLTLDYGGKSDGEGEPENPPDDGNEGVPPKKGDGKGRRKDDRTFLLV